MNIETLAIMSLAIAIPSCIISILALYWGVTARYTHEHVRDLIARVRVLEEQIANCNKAREAVLLQNVSLMKELFEKNKEI